MIVASKSSAVVMSVRLESRVGDFAEIDRERAYFAIATDPLRHVDR